MSRKILKRTIVAIILIVIPELINIDIDVEININPLPAMERTI